MPMNRDVVVESGDVGQPDRAPTRLRKGPEVRLAGERRLDRVAFPTIERVSDQQQRLPSRSKSGASGCARRERLRNDIGIDVVAVGEMLVDQGGLAGLTRSMSADDGTRPELDIVSP